MLKKDFINISSNLKINIQKLLQFFLRHKKIVILTGIIFIVVTVMSTSLGIQHYQKVDFSTGMVTATTLNVRQGPRSYF